MPDMFLQIRTVFTMIGYTDLNVLLQFASECDNIARY